MSAFSSARRLAASVLALGRIRLELLSIELQDERDRLAWLLFWAVFAAWALGLALVLVSALITVWWWDTHRWLGLGIAAVLMLGASAVALWQLRVRTRQPSGLFAMSLAELRRDEQVLRGAPSQRAEPGVQPSAATAARQEASTRPPNPLDRSRPPEP